MSNRKNVKVLDDTKRDFQLSTLMKLSGSLRALDHRRFLEGFVGGC